MHYLTNGGMCSIYTAEWRGRRVVVKVRMCVCAVTRLLCCLPPVFPALWCVGWPRLPRAVGALVDAISYFDTIKRGLTFPSL